MAPWLARTCVLLVFWVAVATCSPGDRSPIFQNCVEQGQLPACSKPLSHPILSRVTHWTIKDECKYACMHSITDAQVERGESVLQYYGKWPFWRVAGMQEPASVVFSAMNFWAHTKGVGLIRERIPSGHPMRTLYLAGAFVNMNAWFWSAVFHTRDLSFTEKMDYFSAALTILFALYTAVVRLFHLYPIQPGSLGTPSAAITIQNVSLPLAFWSLICTVVYVAHVSYLALLPRFDYSYNMAFNVGLGLTHNVLWLLYALPSSLSVFRRFPFRPRTYRSSYAGHTTMFVAATMAAMGLELFDFPPWARTIDAHALWHLATVPIGLLWYRFLVRDALDEGWREQKE